MNRKRALITAAVLLLACRAMASFAHVPWLDPAYWSLAGELRRPEAELKANGCIMSGTTTVFSFCVAHLFASSSESSRVWSTGSILDTPCRVS